LALISSLRARAARGLDATIGVVCCFEAGRDGFWLHRLLTAHGVACHVLEPTSILVNRRARRAKTDRLDAEGMLRVLVAYLRGDHQACSMVRVPTPEEEDAKRTHREREKRMTLSGLMGHPAIYFRAQSEPLHARKSEPV
jgi:transposase